MQKMEILARSPNRPNVKPFCMHPYGLICALHAQAQVKLISHKSHDTFRQGIFTDRVEVLELKVAFVMFSLTTAGS